MVQSVSLLAAACAVGQVSAWGMTRVRTIQARVQGVAPEYDETHKQWVAPYGKTFEDKWRASMDSVNTASVEGALMYVQSEGIIDGPEKPYCDRKNKMQFVWIYDIEIAQTNASLAEYDSDWGVYPEYCPFVALDGGKCSAMWENSTYALLPDVCNKFAGLAGQNNIGPCVGGEDRTNHPKAPYPNNIWFSFPNSCFTKGFSGKTDACRAAEKGGLCPFGTHPDGITCTFSAQVLGYLNLDDLVGITALTNPNTGKPYVTRKEFCEAGGVETDLPFWQDPLDPAANNARSDMLITIYQSLTIYDPRMTPLPKLATLTSENPKCYENSRRCNSGCRRKLYAQVCEACSSGDDCIKKPDSVEGVPVLEKSLPPSALTTIVVPATTTTAAPTTTAYKTFATHDA
ncbi:hypothetical protein H310_00574 [Aphanomyces invadans]|uniref:Secreted protein n=1 Tax=Aphanomyces invadans TaxID=157072 RepID=A0A024UUL7_9STRA|nr:hypothetical protein H310_00574 [Aphanomyces invadans]ETW10216.1 hypothetical protein H310_00574 [Aphanomyces invadans]|eukprot:XP_008861627.1 hypothetical protein H310_00574 [Aphanomyces invadans]